MRVLLVRSRSTGGIGVHVAALAEGLGAAGHRVAVVEAAGRSALPAIRRAAKGADVVHAHGLRAGAAACLAVPSGRRRIVVTLHNEVPPGRLGASLAAIVARRADVVLGASHDLVDAMRRRGARDARFAPVAAALGPTTKTREAARAEFALAAGTKLVLAVGRLAPQKDYATLLDAAGRFEHAHSIERWRTEPLADAQVEHVHSIERSDRTDPPGLRIAIAIAGDGPLRAGLQARIDAERLPVRLLGHRADVPDLLAAADAFVMCSTWEARPLALQEAMRAGLPAVATRVGGIPELVGEAALLIPPRDPDALFRAIVTLTGESSTTSATSIHQAATWPGRVEELAAVLAAYRA